MNKMTTKFKVGALVVAVCSIFSTTVFGQAAQYFHAGSVMLDDGAGHTVLLSPPLSGTGGTITFPPAGLTWPTSNASGVLTNDGAGNLSWIVVGISSTNTTLTGNGTVGSPLGLNLGNANTWTAAQTLPTTSAQGDALIASTNAGTTTIDVTRIGGGLTDAQVNDNLTINGGSLDASPIGSTTASTGRFTTSEATTVLGAASTPAAGTSYRDNAVIAWGDVAAAGVVNDQFGNCAVVHTPGTGVYTITLPNMPTAASTIVTLQSLGLATVTRAGAVLTVTTYDTTGTPTDLDFYFQVVGRP